MQDNKLLNYINGELSKEAGKEFKREVIAKLGISKSTYYRLLNNPAAASKLEKEAIAELAGKEVNQLFTEENQEVNP